MTDDRVRLVASVLIDDDPDRTRRYNTLPEYRLAVELAARTACAILDAQDAVYDAVERRAARLVAMRDDRP
jgi:hypothetical protein